jgi:hypothetical protein
MLVNPSFESGSTGWSITNPAVFSIYTEGEATPYALWKSAMFSAAQLKEPSISGDEAAPAGDGIPNLMKYALDLDPWTDGVSGLPPVSAAATGSGNYITLTYTQPLSATDVTYTVQVSTDLMTWNSGTGYTSSPKVVLNPGGVTQSVTVQAVAPIGGSTPREFIRLQVSDIDQLLDGGFISLDDASDVPNSPVAAPKPSLQRIGADTDRVINAGKVSSRQNHDLDVHHDR